MYKVKGSYTVEAALILPLIFFIIIGLIYLGFYVHDSVKIQSIIDETLIKARNLVQRDADISTGTVDYEAYLNRNLLYPYFSDFKDKESEIKTYMLDRLNSGLFIAKPKNINIKVESFDIHIEVEAEMEFPFTQMEYYFSKSSEAITWTNKNNTQTPMEFIRIFKVFSSVSESSQKVEEAINKLRNIINTVK